MKKLTFWEEMYKGHELLWGLEPDNTLVEYARLIPKGNVLDLGIGEGRNAFFFAKKGYVVEGVDISQKAIEKCRTWAKRAHLKIKAKVRDLRKIEIAQGKYSLIIAAWMLNFFKRKEVEEIVVKIKKGLKKDSFVYLVVFSPRDPSYKKNKQTLKMVEKNTFYSRKRKSYMYYLTKRDVLSLFKDFKVIYCVEGIALDISHGNKPHYHGVIIYMGQKCK